MKKIILITLTTIFVTLLLLITSGLIYLQINYTRIGDINLDINNNQENILNLDEDYTISTHNIGFGAYDRDYSFFMNKGLTLDGEVRQGLYGRAVSKENAIKNTNGVLEIAEYLNTDFMLLQEIDTKSTRSYNVNQVELFENKFDNYTSVFGSNFHSGYMPYPLHDMHGIVNSGILLLSKYNVESANRIELPVTTAFFTKFFDLDRCLTLSRIKIDGTTAQLVIINCHMSAYDEGGVYRALQLELLCNLLETEYSKGNYVIVGGDYNHNIANANFPTLKETPDWVTPLSNDDLPDNYSIQASDLAPTVRDSDSPYLAGETFTSVVDGFIVSDNIEVSLITNIITMNEIDINFLYSDHNAVKLQFSLRG